MGAEFNYFVKELNILVVNNPVPFLYYDTSTTAKYPLKISILSICLAFARGWGGGGMTKALL